MSLDLSEIKKKWVAALRSGEYKQGRGHFKNLEDNTTKYCCLGVLLDILTDDDRQELGVEITETPTSMQISERRWEDGFGESLYYPEIGFEERWIVNDDEEFSDGLLEKLNFSSTFQTRLIAKNDSGVPFDKIADTIEEYPALVPKKTV